LSANYLAGGELGVTASQIARQPGTVKDRPTEIVVVSWRITPNHDLQLQA
jgi:hypothetical protein